MGYDKIGDRMKSQYENRTRYSLPRRTYTIIRLDGKAFHTFTKGFNRPFDAELFDMMNETAKYLCDNIQGAKCAYVQSDEISILMTDFDKVTSDAYFDGNIQKIASISASMATLAFNRRLRDLYIEIGNVKGSKFKIAGQGFKAALFDSRVFTIPDRTEVYNYFVWRQKDATKNSIAMVAQSMYSHKELHGKNTSQMQDMIHEKGENWNNYDAGFKRGRMITKVYYDKNGAKRSRWAALNPPIFTKEPEYMMNLIPKFEEF